MGTKVRYGRISICLILLWVIAIPFVPFNQAVDYYADLTITVDTSGFVTIQGVTNYQNLTVQNTEQYTSKQQSHWLLNITKQDVFSEFVFSLMLPKGSSISYIKSSGTLRIEESLGSLIVRGYGENESLSIVIQYQIEKQVSPLSQDSVVYLVLFSAIILVIILLVFFFFKEKRTPVIEHSTVEEEPPGDLKGLNHRQKEIIRILHEKNIPMTQTDIQRELQIPKASVSRNILGLERKGLIEKEQIGMSNLIRLKKP
jgi:uncharacterized membrane protein